MSQKSGPPAIIFILIFLVLAAAGYYWFFMRQPASQGNVTSGTGTSVNPPTAPVTGGSASFPSPAPGSVPAGTTVRINGSTSMVLINENLKQGFQQTFPGTTVATSASGTEIGLNNLSTGISDIAAISRPLSSSEQAKGLVAVPVANDKIAIVVGNNNPFRKGLTLEQVQGIFMGQITNWSQVGGSNASIRVINRPPESGTRRAFQEMILNKQNFGSTPNITTLSRDATTPMLQELRTDGIGYATYDQVFQQQTVRTLAINGLTPEAENYPYQRNLFYVYKEPASPAVQAFLGYATSPQGQSVMLGQN